MTGTSNRSSAVTEKLALHFTDPVVCDFNVTVLWEAVLHHGWLPYPESVIALNKAWPDKLFHRKEV